MYFGDKADLLFDLGILEEAPGDREEFRAFRELRNRVDHAREYAQTREELHSFLHNVERLRAWIDRLTGILPAEALALPGETDGSVTI
jgi:hypothetical protein